MRTAPAWTLALLLAAAPVAAAPVDPAPIDPGVAERASKEVAAARAAFARGDEAAAIVHFEAALALRPAPKLHYNLGVCHMRLYREADGRDATAASQHAAAAIEAFNTYLRAAPTADDRLEVEGLIRDLGGEPATGAQLRDPLTPASTPATDPPAIDEPTPTPTPIDAADPPPAVADPPPAAANFVLPRGYLGVTLGLAAQPQLVTRTDLDGGYQGLVGLRGGARLGRRHRAEVGAQVWLAVPGETAKNKLALSTQSLLLDAGYAIPLGQTRRFELPVGGFIGVAREALRTRAGQPLPGCAIGATTAALAGARAGGVVGGRLGFAVLVGPRRNHEIGMHLNLAFFGFGPRFDLGPGCLSQDVPRARFVLTGAAGYAFRF